MGTKELQEVKKLRLFADVIGLHPWRERWRQTKIALRGEEDVPATSFGLSSLRQLRPRIGIPLWLGRYAVKRKVVLTNLFNHTQTPIEDGWSVKVTSVKDFRGKKLTYDSHNGTDFSIPVRTRVLTAAPGVVVCVMSEFNRGGLKVFVDHGHGLMTCYAHLAHSLVEVGDVVTRGQAIAISGYSGLDALITFPFGVPHVHFNAWLNCDPVEPFPWGENASLWRAGELPTPGDEGEDVEAAPFAPSVYDSGAVQRAIAGCKTAKVRERLAAIEDLSLRAAMTIIQMNYYPTRFPERVNLYGETFPRAPLLDLPFSKDDFDGIVFSDEL